MDSELVERVPKTYLYLFQIATIDNFAFGVIPFVGADIERFTDCGVDGKGIGKIPNYYI